MVCGGDAARHEAFGRAEVIVPRRPFHSPYASLLRKNVLLHAIRGFSNEKK